VRRVGDRRGDGLLPAGPALRVPLRVRAARVAGAPAPAHGRLPRAALRGLALLALAQYGALRAPARPQGDAAVLLPQAHAAPRPLRDRARLARPDRRRAEGLHPRHRDLPDRPLMRIGIYAPNMATPAPSGVERYIAELLRALAKQPVDHDVALITDDAALPLPARGRRVAVPSMGRLTRLRFDHFGLAKLAREEKLDLLHCTK